MICVVNGRYKISAEALRGVLAEKQPGESLESAIEHLAWGRDGVAKAENTLPSNVAEAARPRRKRVRATFAPLHGSNERRIVARFCACGIALYGKRRFCDPCRWWQSSIRWESRRQPSWAAPPTSRCSSAHRAAHAAYRCWCSTPRPVGDRPDGRPQCLP